MPLIRKFAYAVLTFLLVFGFAEGGLRLLGFRYQRITTYMQFNYPRPGFIKGFFEIDPDLLYRIRPTVKQRYIDLTWQPHFQLKIRDHRTFGPKPAGVLRVLAMGDSSTYGVNTPEPWPFLLQQHLDRAFGSDRAQVLNLGVPGYTLFQGRKVLQTRGQLLQPDAVLIYFGWNDHLLALGFTDAEQRVGDAEVVATRNVLTHSRVYQGLSWIVASLRPAPTTSAEAGPAATQQDPLLKPKRRVGPEDFLANLQAMVDLTRSLGATPLLCTYPTALTHLQEQELPPPEWLVETHVGRGDLQDVVRLQKIYNQAVRQVAAETGSILVDLETVFRQDGKAGLFDDPGGDMIHPNRRGYALVADVLYQELLVLFRE